MARARQAPRTDRLAADDLRETRSLVESEKRRRLSVDVVAVDEHRAAAAYGERGRQVRGRLARAVTGLCSDDEQASHRGIRLGEGDLRRDDPIGRCHP